MLHRNAVLSPNGRLRLGICIVVDGWSLRRAAERFQVAPTTAKRWVDRYHDHGEAGMQDRSSRPYATPRRTPIRLERRIIGVRVTRRWGPARIGSLLGVAACTVHTVLTRYRVPRLTDLDRHRPVGTIKLPHSYSDGVACVMRRPGCRAAPGPPRTAAPAPAPAPTRASRTYADGDE